MSLIILLLLYSCGPRVKGPQVVVKEFPVNVELTGVPLSQADDHIGLYGAHRAARYVVCTQYKQDHFFKIFDSELRLCGEVCRKGRGPNEFLAPAYFGQYAVEDGDTKIWVLERPSERFIKINLSETLRHNRLTVEHQYDLSRYKGLEPRNIFHIDDETLFGTNDDELCATFVVNPTSGAVQFNDHALPFPRSAHTHMLTQNAATLKPDGTMIASCFFSLPQIDIYSSNGKRINSLFFGKVVDPRTVDTSVVRGYYDQICSSNEFIFAMYKMPTGEDTYDNHIHVFDWTGRPRASLKIGAAYDLCFDSERGNLLTVDYDAEIDIFTSYNLSSIFNDQ